MRCDKAESSGLANHTILIAKDGSERPIGDSAAPIKNDRGEMIGVVLVFRDVSEEQLAAEAARKNRDIFRLVHQIGRIGHWEWNSLTDENKWSPEIERFTVWSRAHSRAPMRRGRNSSILTTCLKRKRTCNGRWRRGSIFPSFGSSGRTAAFTGSKQGARLQGRARQARAHHGREYGHHRAQAD